MNLNKLKNKLFRRPGQRAVIAVPYIWLLVLFLIPFAIVLKISSAEQEIAIPPFTPLTTIDEDLGRLNIAVSYQNYADIFQNFWHTLNPFGDSENSNIYLMTYWSSIKTALTTTVICLLVGYPTAYAISRANPSVRNGLLLAIMLPFWTSFLLRVYAWMGLLGHNGIINNLLIKMGIIREPLDLFYNAFSLNLVMVYAYLPFMILPLYTQLVKLDSRLLEAASDLGAGPVKSFLTITLPLSKTGIIAGSMLVFVPAVGEFVIPELVGGSENLMIGKVLWQAFFDQNNWPLASAVAVVMVALLVVPIALFQHYENRELEEEPNNAEIQIILVLETDVGTIAGVSVYPAGCFGHLFVQRIQTCYRLGRLFDQVVRRIAGKRHHFGSRLAVAADCRCVFACRRRFGHAGGLCDGAYQTLSRQHAVCRYDFRAHGHARRDYRSVYAAADYSGADIFAGQRMVATSLLRSRLFHHLPRTYDAVHGIHYRCHPFAAGRA